MKHPTLDRREFPALAGNSCTYLNTGSSGPPPRRVLEAAGETDGFFSGPAHLEGSAFYARLKETNDNARASAARLIGADPEDVALTQNTTHGMNLGVWSVNWNPDDEVISCRTEHPGCLVPLHALRERHGVKVRLLDPPVTPEKVAEEITERTRLVALSHVDWTTGEEWPLADLCDAARERGVTTLVDGAQSVGDISVDVSATGADLYAFTGHKWLLGPEGTGALYVSPGCRAHSTNLGFASLADPAGFDPEGYYELHPGARRFEASTTSPALAAGFAEAADAALERGEAGPEEIQRRAEHLADLLSGLPNVELRSPRPAHSGLVSFEVEGTNAKDAAGRLSEKGFILRHIPDPPYIRASVHLFNTDDELESLARAVAEL